MVPAKRTLVFPSAGVPAARPSERPTLPTLPPPPPSILELSDSALESVPSSAREPRELARTARGLRERLRARIAAPGLRAKDLALACALACAAAAVAVIGMPQGLEGARVPRGAAAQHTPLAPRPLDAIVPPAGGCVATESARVLASRAQLATGLDVSASVVGFGVGFAASGDEVRGVRVDGAPLRVAERVRVRSGPARHVVVDSGAAADDDDGLALRIDADDARSLVAEGGAGILRVAVAGGAVQASLRGEGPARVVTVWPAPGASPAPSGRAAPRSLAPLQVRTAARQEGGAVVALRRGSTLWLGLVDGQLAAEGPLVAVPRAVASMGAPAVTSWGGGGAVAWAERAAGGGFAVVVASFVSAADGEQELPTVRTLGPGMSPALAALPDGDLLLAYAVGQAGAHRVVAQRLARDLSPRGEPIVVSPDAVNAGQPAAAVGAGGRALVAYFGAPPGRTPSVLATPLACDPGL